jgi:exportin-5
MYLFGCLVDHQSAENALPFCYHLIHIARATNHERLKQFILNEMLPTIILLLGVDVKSAISQLYCSLNSTTKEDAMNNITHLCLEIYEVYMDNQASPQVYFFHSVLIKLVISRVATTSSNITCFKFVKK